MVSLFIVWGAFRLVSLFCVGYSITTILPFVAKIKKLTIRNNALYDGETLIYQGRDAADLLMFIVKNYNPEKVVFQVLSWTTERLREHGFKVVIE